MKPEVATAKAESILAAYQRVRVPDNSHIDNSIKEKLQHWSPPLENCLKVNVDAAINNNDQMVRL